MATAQEIRDALAKFPNATPEQILNSMADNGITVQQLASATGKSEYDIATLALSAGVPIAQYQALGGSDYGAGAINPANGVAVSDSFLAKSLLDAAKTDPKYAGVLANSWGIPVARIDKVFGWSAGTAADFAKQNGFALPGMDSYDSGNGTDWNSPHYRSAIPYLNSNQGGIQAAQTATAVGAQQTGVPATYTTSSNPANTGSPAINLVYQPPNTGSSSSVFSALAQGLNNATAASANPPAADNTMLYIAAAGVAAVFLLR